MDKEDLKEDYGKKNARLDERIAGLKKAEKKAKADAKAKKAEVEAFGIYNPFEEMAKKGMGTIAYRDAWDIFDQIMVSETLLQSDYSSFRYWKAGIYNKSFLIQTNGQYKGYPFRSWAGDTFTGGYSDHFPSLVVLQKEFTPAQ